MTTASNERPSAARAVTVWSLELADAARLRAPTQPPARELRMAVAGTPGTSERLYRSVGAVWQWTDRMRWTADRWAAWEQRVETRVAFVDGEEAGYAELDPSQHGSVEIAYFGLLPAFHGLGLGGHLLADGLRRGFALAPRVWVQTCSLDGPHALANYRARGLELFRTEKVLRRSPSGPRDPR